MANPTHPPAVGTPERLADPGAAGPRKLVRPRLSEQVPDKRRTGRREPAPLLAHQELAPSSQNHHGSHAELFYFQKQMQAQTVMVFVLDDGERIEGVIEWYDQHVIKVRHVTRTMIYKASIKYLFKAADVQGHGAAGGMDA